jgi:hypothetical protein
MKEVRQERSGWRDLSLWKVIGAAVRDFSSARPRQTEKHPADDLRRLCAVDMAEARVSRGPSEPQTADKG